MRLFTTDNRTEDIMVFTKDQKKMAKFVSGLGDMSFMFKEVLLDTKNVHGVVIMNEQWQLIFSGTVEGQWVKLAQLLETEQQNKTIIKHLETGADKYNLCMNGMELIFNTIKEIDQLSKFFSNKIKIWELVNNIKTQATLVADNLQLILDNANMLENDDKNGVNFWTEFKVNIKVLKVRSITNNYIKSYLHLNWQLNWNATY